MGYVAFDVCTVPVCGQQQRGARATCGRCGVSNTAAVNTFKGFTSANDTSEAMEKIIARKFEKIGWKIGKRPQDNRCPGCFAAIRIAATRKKKERAMTTTSISSKVVPLNGSTQAPPADKPSPAIETHRPQTRDDRRLIHIQLEQVYLDERQGYSAGWSDKRIAEHLNVPRAWVAKIREENFGPDLDEASTKVIAEGHALLAELRSFSDTAQPVLTKLQELAAHAAQIEQALQLIEGKKP